VGTGQQCKSSAGWRLSCLFRIATLRSVRKGRVRGISLHLNGVRLMHTAIPGGMVLFPVAGGSVRSVVMVMSVGYHYAVINGNVTLVGRVSTWNSSNGYREL